LEGIDECSKTVLPANKKHLKKYLGDEGIGDIKYIVESVYTNALSWDGDDYGQNMEKLEELQRDRMQAQIRSMKEHLAGPKYQLDSAAAVQAVTGTQQTERVSPAYLIQIFDLNVIHLRLFYACYTSFFDVTRRSSSSLRQLFFLNKSLT
jgi:hypothetical protein